MGTSKWHLFDHVVEGIKRKGGICYMNSGLYKMVHKHFKSEYSKTSRRDGQSWRKPLGDGKIKWFLKTLHPNKMVIKVICRVWNLQRGESDL